MRPFLSGRGSLGRGHALSGMHKWRLVMQGSYKFVRGWRNEPLLFDRRNDPHENDNLATAKPELAARLAKLPVAG